MAVFVESLLGFGIGITTVSFQESGSIPDCQGICDIYDFEPTTSSPTFKCPTFNEEPSPLIFHIISQVFLQTI